MPQSLPMGNRRALMPLSRATGFTSAYADGMKTAQGTNGNDGVVGELAAVRGSSATSCLGARKLPYAGDAGLV